MDNGKQQQLRHEGFGFFGAITASLSHEMNNVFAIINELSGLLLDFFAAAGNGADLDVERLQATSERIVAQVERGRGYVRRLNRFAHTVDDAHASIDVNDAVESGILLCRRFGKLRQVELEKELPDAPPQLTGSLFQLLHIIYRCVDIMLAAATPDGAVRIRVEARDKGARLTFAGSSDVTSVEGLEAKKQFLDILVDEARGELEGSTEAGRPARLVVSLPCTLGAPSDGVGPA